MKHSAGKLDGLFAKTLSCTIKGLLRVTGSSSQSGQQLLEIGKQGYGQGGARGQIGRCLGRMGGGHWGL